MATSAAPHKHSPLKKVMTLDGPVPIIVVPPDSDPTAEPMMLGGPIPRPISRQSSLNDTNRVEIRDLTLCRASCHCRGCDFRVTFPTASLPMPSYFCHCSSCRHNTGQMAFCTARIVGVPLDPEDDKPYPLSIMDSYRPADRHGVERFFCPTCSCNLLVRVDMTKTAREMADRNKEPEDCALGRNRTEELDEWEEEDGFQWRIASGALRVSEGIIKPMHHLHLASTHDGGLSSHLRRYDGVDLPRYSEGVGSPQLPLDWRSPALQRAERSEVHTASCHCKSIIIEFLRPTPAAATVVHAPYPDLLYPTDVTLRARQRNPKDEKWWLRPPRKEGEPTRYLAGHCACTYCRATGGFEFNSWAFVPRFLISEAGKQGEVIELYTQALRPKGLKQYLSKVGRYREFCGKCGATVFWWHAGREELIDISAGVLDSSIDGVRAEHWFQWHKDRVSNIEMSPSPKIMDALVDGLKECEVEDPTV